MLFASTAVILVGPIMAQRGSAEASTQDSFAAAATPSPKTATQAPAQNGIEEVVVTAQKRSQLLKDVPIAITALTSAQLTNRGVVDTADLGKVVSGFVFTTSDDGQPVYTLRGVGLYDSGLASSPAVSVYVDQAPLSFSAMTTGATLDLARVEVIKGPQGTLFGQNNTGGAINYIAAKPTDYLSAGIDTTYQSYNKSTVDGFVSGPLTSTLDARLSFKTVNGGAWQYSASRPDDHLGNERQDFGRLLLDWRPTDNLKVSANLNTWWDGSDTQAPQLQRYIQAGATYYPDAVDSPLVPARNSREANWAPDQPLRTNNHLLQAVIRADYTIDDHLTFTSLSDFANFHYRSYNDIAGDQVNVGSVNTFGKIDDLNQEARLAGRYGRLNWVLGANYEHTRSVDDIQAYVANASTNKPFGPGSAPFTLPGSSSDQTHGSYAIFGNAEYKITPRLTLQGGLRATQTDQKVSDCSFDNTPGSPLSSFFTFLEGLLAKPGTVVRPIAPFACYVLNPATNFSAGAINEKLDQGNVSYRTSLAYEFESGINTYVSISRGYKAGIFTNIPASSAQQSLPVKQERLDAYEVGVKAPLMDKRLQVNVAGFYYDYTDKQVRGKLLDPIFGLLETLVTVPKSKIYGVDADLTYVPFRGLILTAGGTYEDSEIDAPFSKFNSEPVYDSAGHNGNFEGSQLPYTPHFTGNADVDYEWSVGHGLMASVGAGLSYHDIDNSTYQANGALPDPEYKIRAYTLLDLRAGLSSPDHHWRIEVFGHNVTNEAYSTAVYRGTDTLIRYAGMPEVYGVTLGYRF